MTPRQLVLIRRVVEMVAPLGGRLAPGTRVEAVDLAHEGQRVVGEWVSAPGARSDAAGLYFHGGGFAVCSPRTHRAMISRLSAAGGVPVFSAEYRMGPRYRFPAGHQDAITAYRWLLTEGYAPDRIVIAGDSAGGHLAPWVALEAAAHGLPAPGAVVMLSPYLQPSWELAHAREALVRDPYLVPNMRRMVDCYLAGAEALEEVDLLRRDLQAFPPALIQVGSEECLSAACEAFADRLSDAGASIELQVWPGQVHVFQAFAALVPESVAAIAEIGRFVRQAVASPSANPV